MRWRWWVCKPATDNCPEPDYLSRIDTDLTNGAGQVAALRFVLAQTVGAAVPCRRAIEKGRFNLPLCSRPSDARQAASLQPVVHLPFPAVHGHETIHEKLGVMAQMRQESATPSEPPQGSEKTGLRRLAVVISVLFAPPLLLCLAFIVCSTNKPPEAGTGRARVAIAAQQEAAERERQERVRREREKRRRVKAAADAEKARFRALTPAAHLAAVTKLLASGQESDLRLVTKHLDAVPWRTPEARQADALRLAAVEKALELRNLAEAQRLLDDIPEDSPAQRKTSRLQREISRVGREIEEEHAATVLAQAQAALERRNVVEARRLLDSIPPNTRAARRANRLRRRITTVERELQNARQDATKRASTKRPGGQTCAGGLLDPTTRLCWQNPPPDREYNWREAVAYCRTLSRGGHGPGSWHLPTISELRSLIRGCPATETGGACGVTDACRGSGCWSLGCDGCSSRSGPGTGGAYWPAGFSGPVDCFWSSSSSYPGGLSLAWGVYFDDGDVNFVDQSVSPSVRCVRGGP